MSSSNLRHRHLEGRHQVGLGERLDEVGHRAGVPGPLDQLALGEGGEYDDGREPCCRDAFRRGDAVQARHLHIEDDQVRAMLLRQRDRLLTVGGFGDDDVALFFEHLLEVEPDQRLVLGDHDATTVRSMRGSPCVQG